MMNLVLFGWFSTNPFFNEMTDINVKDMIYAEQIKMIEEDLVPFGVVDDGHEPEYIYEGGDMWKVDDEGSLY